MFRVLRTSFDSLNEFDDASGPGVYFLIGDEDSGGKRQLYVGESDDVLKRLLQHDSRDEKSFWKDTVVLVGKDENLTKSHTLYLESRLIKIAHEAGQVSLANATSPDKSLPRPDQSDMEYFIEQILLMMPVMGYSFLNAPTTVPQEVALQSYPKFDCSIGDVTATMEVRGHQFVVLAGSHASGTENVSINPGYTAMRASLVENGTLVLADGTHRYTFARDAVFPSPTRAAVMVYGGNISGPKYWRLQGTSQTYGEWRESQTRNSIPDAPSPTDAVEAEFPVASAVDLVAASRG
jgi:predicted GIY-YIG superfamily endonuclease